MNNNDEYSAPDDEYDPDFDPDDGPQMSSEMALSVGEANTLLSDADEVQALFDAVPVAGKTKRKSAPLYDGVAGEDHPDCIKCGLFKNCQNPFMDSMHYKDGEWITGPPVNSMQYVLVVGDPPEEVSDNEGLLYGEDLAMIEAAATRLGFLDQLWYTPGVRCRPTKTNKRNEGRLSKPEIKRCWTKHILPTVRANPPRAIVGAGAVGTFATMGRMDAQRLEGQWYMNDLGMVYGLRSVETLNLNFSVTNQESYLAAFRFAFEHRRDDISFDIEFTVGKTLEVVKAWFEPVLQYMEENKDAVKVIPLSWDTETSSVTALWKKKGTFKIALWSFDHPMAEGGPLLIPTPDYVADPLGLTESVRIMEWLRGVMESRVVRKVGHNLQYDENAIYQQYGWKVQGFLADTLIMDFLLDSEEKRHALDLLCCRYLPEVPRYWEALDEWKGGLPGEVDNYGYTRVPSEILYPYAAWDTLVVSRIYAIHMAKMEERSVAIPGRPAIGGWFMMSQEPPDVTTLSAEEYCLHGRRVHHLLCTHLERTGTHIDRELVGIVRKHYSEERERARQTLEDDPDVARFETEYLPDTISKSAAAYKQFKKFGTRMTINWASVPQVRSFFIGFLNLEVLKRTKSKEPSLDAEVIDQYAARGVGSAKALGGFRKADKFMTSFLDPLEPGPETVLHEDGMIHPGYKSAGTATGRLACGGGYNMQAMPRDGAIKKIFNSRYPGGWIVTRDYSGIEVRILAIVSRDPTLCAAFREGKDVHFVTQQFFFREKADAKNKTQRSICKRALFGRLYGQGDKGLFDLLTGEGVISVDTGVPITLEECKAFNQLIDQLYPGVAEWVTLAHDQGLNHKFCCSLFGFYRPLPGAMLYERQKELKQRYGFEELRYAADGEKLDKATDKMVPFAASDAAKKASRDFRKISAAVAEAQRHSQNSPIQSAASDLTVFAAWIIQKRLEALDPRCIVIDVIHDDIWVDCPTAELVAEVVAIQRDVMDRPQDWLPELLPGFNCDWMDIPIIGECELGLSPKDAMGCYEEPSRGHPLDPGEMVGELKMVTSTEYVETYGYLNAIPHPKADGKSIIPFLENAPMIRDYLMVRRTEL